MSHVISCAVIIAALVLRGNIKAARHTLGVSSRAALDLVSRCRYILDLTLTFRNALSLITYVTNVCTYGLYYTFNRKRFNTIVERKILVRQNEGWIDKKTGL